MRFSRGAAEPGGVRRMGLIDSHAHLSFPELAGQIGEVLNRASEAGVEEVITVGVDLADARRSVQLAERHPGRIHVAAGFHPHEAEKVTAGDFAAMLELWDHPGIVAFGEIGLDYHYDLANRDVQRSVFVRQLESAASRGKPLVIHAREALDDTIRVLHDHGYTNRPVVFHCFTGKAEEADRIAAHGWRISFTGVVTFRKSQGLQEIAGTTPRRS